MKKYSALILFFFCILGLTACEPQQTQDESNSSASLASFSFEEDGSIYTEGSPNVKTDGFLNADAYPIADQTAAVERAKNECTIQYNATTEYYDSLTDMWRIDFFTLDRNEQGQLISASEYQSVYLDCDGITQLIVYGE